LRELIPLKIDFLPCTTKYEGDIDEFGYNVKDKDKNGGCTC